MTSLRKPLSLSLLLCAALAASAQNPDRLPDPVQPPDGNAKRHLSDSVFVELAAASNMAEVELAKLALKKTGNEKLKSFAEQMMKDHETASQRLRQVAQDKGLRLPTALDPEHQKRLVELQRLSGTQFDEAYVNTMKQDHDTVVGLFDNAAGETTLSSELREYAGQTLPVLRMHQQRAHALSDTAETRMPTTNREGTSGGSLSQ